MKHMVSYKLKPDRIAENERLVAAVFEALKQARPSGLRYATFRKDDGVSFVHIVSHEEPDGAAPDDIIGILEQGRRQFLALVDHVRPELHRYCTRMTGSVADGEDVVQETLARAYYELSELKSLPLL